MRGRDHRWGFRCSVVDLAVVALATAATWGLWPLVGDAALGIPVVVGHFFLFCNVVRLRRGAELLWAAAFAANAGAWLLLGELRWGWVLALQTPLTAALVLREMRSPSYHGVAADRLNPRLPAWLAERPISTPDA
jgi:hypothetical protein